jgi:hypothetical protein
MCWELDSSSCYGKRIRECLFSQHKQDELSGVQRLKVSLAVRPMSVGFDVFPPRIDILSPKLSALNFM